VVPGGEPVVLRLTAALNGLSPNDVVVECLLIQDTLGQCTYQSFRPVAAHNGSELSEFVLALSPPDTGLYRMQVRMYPYHAQLLHRFEMGCMHWL